jgi:hypothetical protein
MKVLSIIVYGNNLFSRILPNGCRQSRGWVNLAVGKGQIKNSS